MSSSSDRQFNVAISIVLIAGVIWSFGPLVVRNIYQPELVSWQYLFMRGATIFILINIYLLFKEGISFINNYSKLGKSGLIGALGLSMAMISFIWSITNTSTAITMLLLATMPFITVLLGYIFLGEKISLNSWIAILIAVFGIGFIAKNNDYSDTAWLGWLFGSLSSLGFSIFSVSLRWRRETPKFTTVAIAGLLCSLFSLVIILASGDRIFSSLSNELLFSLHGVLVCSGLILYSIGSKHLPAADLTLLSLTEVVGGIFWVWLPFFNINETPSNDTIIGGNLILFAIFYYSFYIKKNRRFIGLN